MTYKDLFRKFKMSISSGIWSLCRTALNTTGSLATERTTGAHSFITTIQTKLS